jgi:hypothetical protein
MYGVRCTIFPVRDKQITLVEWANFGFMVYCPQGGLGVLPTIDTFYALTVYSHRLLGSFKSYPLTYLDSLWQKRIGRARCPHVLI